MYCCEHCFKDVNAQKIIKDFGECGACSFCNSKNCKVIDLSKDNALSSACINLLDAYEIDEQKGKNLLDSIKEWNIFNTEDKSMTKRLIQELCASSYEKTDPIYNDNAKLSINIEDIRNDNQILSCSWSDFVNKIKHECRFFNSSNYSGFYPDAFAWWLKNVLCMTPECETLYRARIISDPQQNFTVNDMYEPPVDKCSAGRINPEGIPVLYLATKEDTVLYEVRAYLYDLVCTGYFRYLKKDSVKLINLANIEQLSPFSPIICDNEENIKRLKLNLNTLKEIAKTISKPLRKTDSILEYIPTQFLAEFIKLQKYDGIIYKSTMISNGMNVALFNTRIVECYDVKEKEVTDINIQYRELSHN